MDDVVDADVLGSMMAAILNGVPKDECRLVHDETTSRTWDKLAEEISELKANAAREGRTISWQIPND